MHRYIINRLLLAIPTLAGAAALVFILMRLIPGDVCVIRLGSGGSACRPGGAGALPPPSSGSTSPMFVQFLISCGATPPSISASRCGRAIRWRRRSLIRLPVSLEVAILATVIAILIAIPLGTISALKENTWLDHVVRVAGDRRHRHAVVLARHHVADPGAQHHLASRPARRGCRRSTTCRCGRTRSATCRWCSCRRSRSATAIRR